jgi:hypothetical protein
MNDVVEKTAANAYFAIIARAAMVASLGVASWMALAIITLQTDVKVLTATINFTMTDRYKGDDAKRDLAIRDLKIDALDQRVRDIEHEVRATKLDVKQNEQKIEQVVPKHRP